MMIVTQKVSFFTLSFYLALSLSFPLSSVPLSAPSLISHPHPRPHRSLQPNPGLVSSSFLAFSAPARLSAVSDDSAVPQNTVMMSTFSLPQMGNKQSKFFVFLAIAAIITFLSPFYHSQDGFSIFRPGSVNEDKAPKPPPKVVTSKPPPPMDADYEEGAWQPPKPHKDLKLEDDPVREHKPAGMNRFVPKTIRSSARKIQKIQTG